MDAASGPRRGRRPLAFSIIEKRLQGKHDVAEIGIVKVLNPTFIE